MHQFISGTFDDADKANKAVDDIMAMDYPRERITIIMSAQTRNRFWSRRSAELKRQNETYSTNGTSREQMSGDTIGAIVDAGESGLAHGAPVGKAIAASRLFVAGPAAAALGGEGAPYYTPASVLRTLARFGMPRFDA